MDNYLTNAVTLKKLLDLSKDRKMDDVVLAYSNPDYVKKHAREIVWISPREPHPFLGEQPASGQYYGCHINSLHMRSKKEVTIPKPLGRIRIFLIGASTAYSAGSCSEEETIGQYLEDELNRLIGSEATRAEVFTSACPQWSSTHERILIENRLARLEPDLVVALSGAADIFWTCQGQDTFEVATDWFQEFIRQSNHPLDMAGAPRIKSYPRASFQNSSFDVMTENYLLNIRQSALLLAQKRVPLLCALQPSLITCGKEKSPVEKKNYDKFEYRCAIKNEQVKKGYETLRQGLGQMSCEHFSFTDLTTVFDGWPGEHFFMDSFHFGDKGNRVIGEKLGKAVYSLLMKNYKVELWQQALKK